MLRPRTETARRWGFVGLAFLVGLGVGALVLAEGGPIASLGVSPLAVEVFQLGPNPAVVEIAVTEPLGGGIEHWSQRLEEGQTARVLVREPPSGQVAVRVHAQWDGQLDGGAGETTTLVRPSDCGGGKMLVVRYDLDTARGVSFSRAQTRCA